MAMDNKKVERWIDTPTGAKKYEGVNQNYKGLTASVMRDWVDAQKRASDLKLNHKDMMKIVADYNNAVCADDSCIVYWSNNPTPLKYPMLYLPETFPVSHFIHWWMILKTAREAIRSVCSFCLTLPGFRKH